eukprot:scaffold74268_cov74-Phaeocystis_antarctica.AAC.2
MASALQVDTRPMLEQQAHHGMITQLRSHHDRRAGLRAAQVDAGTALQQLLHHAQLPIRHGHVQQTEPVLV